MSHQLITSNSVAAKSSTRRFLAVLLVFSTLFMGSNLSAANAGPVEDQARDVARIEAYNVLNDASALTIAELNSAIGTVTAVADFLEAYKQGIADSNAGRFVDSSTVLSFVNTFHNALPLSNAESIEGSVLNNPGSVSIVNYNLCFGHNAPASATAKRLSTYNKLYQVLYGLNGGFNWPGAGTATERCIYVVESANNFAELLLIIPNN